MVDIIGAEALADELLEQIGLLVGALGRAEAGQRLAAMLPCRIFFRPPAARSSASSHVASRNTVSGSTSRRSISPAFGASSRRISGLVSRRATWHSRSRSGP